MQLSSIQSGLINILHVIAGKLKIVTYSLVYEGNQTKSC